MGPPADESFVLVANHASHLDTLCLLAALPLRRLHRAYPAAAADYFFVNVARRALAVLVVNALPFHRVHSKAQGDIYLEGYSDHFPVCVTLVTGPASALEPGSARALAKAGLRRKTVRQ